MRSWPAPLAALLERVHAWAISQPKVTGLALVGSWARGRPRPDSDIDLIILTEDPALFTGDVSWVGLFGEVLQSRIEAWGLVLSIRTWYRDGPEVEYGLAPGNWAAPPLDPGTDRVIRNGMIILHDPSGSLDAALRSIEATACTTNRSTLDE